MSNQKTFFERFPWLSTTLLTLGMLIPGTLNTLSKKAQNQTLSIGINGELAPFHHPWFQTFVMYIGEGLCFLVFLIVRFRYDRQLRDEQYEFDFGEGNKRDSSILLSSSGLFRNPSSSSSSATTALLAKNNKSVLEINLPEDDNDPESRLQAQREQQKQQEEEEKLLYTQNPLFAWKFIIPTVFDLLGTTLSGIGLLWVPASIWQMLRGSVIIFSGILSVVFLKKPLGIQKWIGIAVTAVGLCFVGLSSLLGNQSSDVSGAQLSLGVFLVVIAQLFQAMQMTIEEAFMKGLSGVERRKWLPVHVVGMEGCFGIVIVYFLCFPITYAIPGSTPGSHYDNPADAIAQMLHSWSLSLNVFIYILSIAFYNYFSLTVAKKLSTVHRALIDASRTILVWGVDLLLYYAAHLYAFGEAWVTPWSFIQLFGFIVLFLGTLMYNRVITLPYLPPPPEYIPPVLPPHQSFSYRLKHCTWLLD